VEPFSVILSIIIATIGRASLERTLASIPEDPRVQIVLVYDGVQPNQRNGRFVTLSRYPRSGDAAYTCRNMALSAAAGDWLAFMDDDDYFTKDGVLTIVDYCSREKRPAVFRMQRLQHGDTLWLSKDLTLGNQGQQQFVCPNRPDLPRWQTHYTADFNWMKKVSDLSGGVNFHDAVTVVCPRQNMGQ
jgi:glycosyltransferase involved in cell wall biosynthesis